MGEATQDRGMTSHTLNVIIVKRLDIKLPTPINNRDEEKVNYVEKRSQEDGNLLMGYKENERGEDNTWYLDTNARNHVWKKEHVCRA